MNGKVMFRQTRAKQANAQKQARQPNKQMVAKVQADARCPNSTEKAATSIERRLNIQPMDHAKI